MPFSKSSIDIGQFWDSFLVLISDTNFTALAFSLLSTPRNLVRALQDSEGIFQVMNTDKLKIIFYQVTSLSGDENRDILNLNVNSLNISLQLIKRGALVLP